MKYLVSACLLGEKCKYNGGDNYNEELVIAIKDHTVVPICPEVEGGLPVPRNSVEIVDGKALDAYGNDYTSYFIKGRDKVFEIVSKEKPDAIILQPRSPSCGSGYIYDGSFSSVLVKGNGFFADKLKKEGYKVYTPQEFLCHKN